MYIIYYALVGTYIMYIYIFSYSAVATAAVLQTIRPSRMPATHLQPQSPSLAYDDPRVSRHTTVIPTHLRPPPPARYLPIYYNLHHPSVSARPCASRDLRAAEFTATVAPSPPRRLPLHPRRRHQDSIYYGIHIYIRALGLSRSPLTFYTNFAALFAVLTVR